jgi:broad specificity phosphatase PhoE
MVVGARDLLIIRHGETGHNARRILQPPDTPLSDRGREQARLLAERLADAGVRRIVSSDLARAAETARALGSRTGVSIEWEPLLHERNFGDLRGTAYDDLGLDPFADHYEPPGGESWAVFRARVAEAWRVVCRHAEQADGSLAVVTHGLVCREIVAVHLDVPSDIERADYPWANTCLTIAEAAPPWRARLIADATHLDEVQKRGRSLEV